MERIDRLSYKDAEFSSTVEGKEGELFITGPAEFLCQVVADELREKVVWRKVFGEFIDGYKRMDYPMRALPAVRIYNNSFRKGGESWYIEGDLVADIIFPANLRRRELQQLPDTVSAAMVQQFRAPAWFKTLYDKVPGLNELGKIVNVDKSLAFEWGDSLVPLTQIELNFRIDLKVWDLYLESDNRTKDLPFERTLGDLEKIVSKIEALRDDNEKELEVDLDQNI